jgi:hypothetical protein
MIGVTDNLKQERIKPEMKVFEHALTTDDFSNFLIICVACFHFGQGFWKQV